MEKVFILALIPSEEQFEGPKPLPVFVARRTQEEISQHLRAANNLFPHILEQFVIYETVVDLP